MKQNKIFLESEGNAYFERNAKLVSSRKLPESDPLLVEILTLPTLAKGTKILEIGCGAGERLSWLKENRGFDCYGVEPSAKAVEAAKKQGILAHQGTADHLPFDDNTFDVIMFGFCLYLCDRNDLFRIACEADRVLKNPGWLLIQDFYSPSPVKREYHHRSGLFTYKMDYSALFTWNPLYVNFAHKIWHHSEGGYTDDLNEWVFTSVLRKNLKAND